MAIQRYAVGIPGNEAMMVECEECDLASHLSGLEVAIPTTLSKVKRWIITEDEQLVERAPTFEENQQLWYEITRKISNKAMGLGCWTPKGMIDSNEKSQGRLGGYAVRAIRDASFTVVLTMLDDQEIEHNADEIIAAHDALTDYVNAVHQRSRALKAAIMAATTQEELDAIEPSDDWPDNDKQITTE